MSDRMHDEMEDYRRPSAAAVEVVFSIEVSGSDVGPDSAAADRGVEVALDYARDNGLTLVGLIESEEHFREAEYLAICTAFDGWATAPESACLAFYGWPRA